MRISELVKREPFLEIIENTLFEAEKEHKIGELINTVEGSYFINKYINFITTLPKSKEYFINLSNEYSIGKTFLRTILQSSYVFLATNNFTLPFLCNKIKFKFTIKNFLILGGNHRIRLSNEIKGQIFVLLKKGEDTKLIVDEINFRKSCDSVSYIPKLIDNGRFWFQEEFIYATPINRLKKAQASSDLKIKCYELHERELLIPNYEEVNVISYVDQLFTKFESKIKYITAKGNNEKVTNRALSVFNELSNLKEKFSKYVNITIPITITHGDFQSSNILIDSKNKPVVIDWEMVSTRFMLYDLFVLMSGIREGNSFSISYENYDSFKCNHSKYFIKIVEIPEDLIKLLIIIEEFSFLIMNDWSINFYEPGMKTDKFMLEYNSFLND